MSGSIALGYTTVADEKQAKALADQLLESGYVACVQCAVIESLYCFKGKKCLEKEIQLTLKFPIRHAEMLEKYLVAHHPYALPQWLYVEAQHAYAPYQNWVEQAGGRQH